MLDTFLTICDALFGWLLVLPTTLVVIIVAAMSSLAMVIVRKWTTDQAFLGRCVADKKRLKSLRRAARKRKDRPTAKRHTDTLNRIQRRMLGREVWPLLAGLIPIAVLGTWSYYRLAYIPPSPEEPIAIELSLPASSIGSLATMVPLDGVACDQWIARVESGPGPIAHGLARWTITADVADEPYRLAMRHRDQTYEHLIRIGDRVYAPPVQMHSDASLLPQSLARLRPVKIFGVIPWFDPTTMIGMFFPAWLITYIAVVLPMVFVFKIVFRLH